MAALPGQILVTSFISPCGSPHNFVTYTGGRIMSLQEYPCLNS